jgi:septin family protein
MLEGISSLVAVVPVIAKADTHTAPELEAYRREVIQVRNVLARVALTGF